MSLPKLQLVSATQHRVPARTRMPFRFGIAVMTEAAGGVAVGTRFVSFSRLCASVFSRARPGTTPPRTPLPVDKALFSVRPGRTSFRSLLVFLSMAACSSAWADLRPWEFFPTDATANGGHRRALLTDLLGRLPSDVVGDAFNHYLRKSGELPPDFADLPSNFLLPDPLVWSRDGRPAAVTREDWPHRREEIARLTEEWLLGHAPPPPGNVKAEILDRSTANGHEVWKVRLAFGPDHAAKLGVTLYLPKNRTPSAIFLCDGERFLPWAAKAMEHGFGFAIHNARDGTRDESLAYADLFGDYDWSAFRRRAWSMSRVLDWLVTLPFVDPGKVYVGGHSRSAKVAMTAAAFDERFAGVIASSPGAGGSIPYRYSDQSYFGESAEVLTRKYPDWVHLRVRMFSGNEDKLPADSHFLYALIAPRPVLMSTATEDSVESSWAVEQVYRSIKPVYALLGADTNYVRRYRPGGHAVNDRATQLAFSDFLLTAGNRDRPLSELFPQDPLHPWDYEAWAARNPVDIGKHRSIPYVDTSSGSSGKPGDVAPRIQWLLGNDFAYERKPAKLAEDSVLTAVVRNHFEKMVDLIREGGGSPHVTTTLVTFGEGVVGCLYRPEEATSHPLVIWLGPFQASQGYAAPFYRVAMTPPAALVRAGIPVFTYDPVGTFLRQEEREKFFDRHPDASLMGKMILDTRHAIDAATELMGDGRPVYLYGYAMGGTVALLAAGLDDRVAGVASVAGFTPLRTDTPGKRTGGLARLSHLYGWMPRLGAFIGHEDRVPVDYDEILASIAPRRVLIVAPTLDRYATHEDVLKAVEHARAAYRRAGNAEGIAIETPHDENRLTDAMQRKVIDWLKRPAPPLPDRGRR